MSATSQAVSATPSETRHHGGFATLERELDYHVPHGEIRGTLPAALRGTLFRIGPGRNRIGDQVFGHWFDGDGMVHAISFTDSGARYRNRYVRTPKYLAETRANRIVMRSFGHNAPGGVRKNIGRLPANCANTNLLWHGGKLLALWEGGRPWQLDPATLETLGEYDFDGRLGRFSTFSAHAKVNPATGECFNFGMRPSTSAKGLLNGRGAIDLYRIAASGSLQRRGSFEVDFVSFCHDYALTEHYMVFFLSPVAMKSPLRWLAGLESFSDALSWQPERGMKVYVVRTSDFVVERVFELDDPFVAIHFSNAWEDARGNIQIDLTRFADFSINDLLSDVFNHEGDDFSGTFWRYTLDMGNNRVEARPWAEALRGEFPQWDQRFTTRPTRFMYAACMMSGQSTFFDGIERIDLDSGDTSSHGFGPGRYTSEAIHVPPSGNEDHEGWLACVVYDASVHQSEVVVCRADTLEEVAVVPLRNHVPFGFHGGYSRKTFVA